MTGISANRLQMLDVRAIQLLKAGSAPIGDEQKDFQTLLLFCNDELQEAKAEISLLKKRPQEKKRVITNLYSTIIENYREYACVHSSTPDRCLNRTIYLDNSMQWI